MYSDILNIFLDIYQDVYIYNQQMLIKINRKY